jgi:hypothetical protein
LAIFTAVLLPLLLAASNGLVRVIDFGCYWCGAKINAAGGDPYDAEQVAGPRVVGSLSRVHPLRDGTSRRSAAMIVLIAPAFF